MAQTYSASSLSKPLPRERRVFRRYERPAALPLEAYWNGRALLLDPRLNGETISGGGVVLCLAEGPLPPVDTELEVSFPLVERPFHPDRVYARCRARVLRHEAPSRVVVRFQEVELMREERPSGLPVPLLAKL